MNFKKAQKKEIDKAYGVAVSLTFHNAADMTPAGAKSIADWLSWQRKEFLKQRKEYAKRATIRYWYKKPKAKKK